MAGFFGGLKRAGKAIGRAGKARMQQRLGIKPSASAAGSDPVADAVREEMTRKKGRSKTRD